MLTLNIIKADTGGFVGYSAVHPEMMAVARDAVDRAVRDGLLVGGTVASCGDDVSLVMTRHRGPDDSDVHSFAWDTFHETTALANRLGLCGAGQDLLSDAFSGILRGMGPGYTELEFEPRPSEPVLCFLVERTEPGAWNLRLYKIFADPFNTAGLVIDTKMHTGVRVRGLRSVRACADRVQLPGGTLRHADVHRRPSALRRAQRPVPDAAGDGGGDQHPAAIPDRREVCG